MPPIRTVPPGSVPNEELNTRDDLYKIVTRVNFVLVPVTVKDTSGHMVDGLLPRDFNVFEDGKKQELKFFTSDPFPLSAAVVLDTGMPDTAEISSNEPNTHRARYRPRAMPATSCASATAGHNNASRPAWM